MGRRGSLIRDLLQLREGLLQLNAEIPVGLRQTWAGQRGERLQAAIGEKRYQLALTLGDVMNLLGRPIFTNAGIAIFGIGAGLIR